VPSCGRGGGTLASVDMMVTSQGEVDTSINVITSKSCLSHYIYKSISAMADR
jgi:hypothetical protein